VVTGPPACDNVRVNVLVVHGPNLNLLGEREPEVYGAQSLADVDAAIAAKAATLGITTRHFQSNHEGALIDKLHAERRWMDAVIINGGGLTHTSVSLRDAIAAVHKPAVEVHLSNTQAREPFRHHSFLTGVCVAKREGKGLDSYLEALELLATEHRPG
jgi:3-dehydroquinate dehydratase-2